jgi:hypothetical protein
MNMPMPMRKDFLITLQELSRDAPMIRLQMAMERTCRIGFDLMHKGAVTDIERERSPPATTPMMHMAP